MAELKTEVKAPEAETKVSNGPVNNRKLEEDKTESPEVGFDAHEQAKYNRSMATRACMAKYEAFIRSIGSEDKIEMKYVPGNTDFSISMMIIPGTYMKTDSKGEPIRDRAGKVEYVTDPFLPSTVMIKDGDRKFKMSVTEALQIVKTLRAFLKDNMEQVEFAYMLEKDILARKAEKNLLEDF